MRKNVKNVICALLVLSLALSTALLAYLHFFAPGSRDLTGEWTGQLDMTGQAAARAYGWLQDIDAVSITLEEMEERMRDLTIQVSLTIEETERSRGNFRCSVSPESYETCKQAAYEVFAEDFRGLVAERLRMAGYGGGTDGEAVEALITETFGMSTVSYLMTSGPALLPSLEELQAGYDGSGTYEVSEGVLLRQFDVGGTVVTKAERYIREEDCLILTGEAGDEVFGESAGQYPVAYFLERTENE